MHDPYIRAGIEYAALSCHVLIEDVPPSLAIAFCALTTSWRTASIRHTTAIEHVGCAVSENGCGFRWMDEHGHHHHNQSRTPTPASSSRTQATLQIHLCCPEHG
jgi:hypothetical protein